MSLAGWQKQILAGICSGLGFLFFYFVVYLTWWAAIGLSLAIYMAIMMIVVTKQQANEIFVARSVTKADLQKAGDDMGVAIERLQAVLPTLSMEDKVTVQDLVTHIESIRVQVVADPEDYRRARRLITSYLGHMVAAVERFADLSKKASGRQSERLIALSQQIKGFIPVVAKIDNACLDNDFTTVEIEMKVLAEQLKRV